MTYNVLMGTLNPTHPRIFIKLLKMKMQIVRTCQKHFCKAHHVEKTAKNELNFRKFTWTEAINSAENRILWRLLVTSVIMQS